MATQYTNILKLALPVQGELSGTWGDVVNDNITEMVEEAIAGRKVINTWTANSHTLTTADGTTSESRAAILTLTDTGTALTGAGTVICPANSKVYIVENGAGQTITVKTSSGTGVAVPNGENMVVFCDGTNVEQGITNINNLNVTGTITFDGGTTSADLNFGDNDKAIFGAGSDLSIFHDGSSSVIRDSGTGNLAIQAEDFAVQSADASATHIFVDASSGYTALNYGGSTKLNTSSTGIDVTGSVVSDGLTVNGDVLFEGTANDVIVNSSTNNYPFYVSRGVVKTEALAIGVDDSDAILNSIQDERYGGYKFESTYSGTGTRTRMQIGQNTGDISFYNDAGTSQDFYWDASESRLGLGTTTPAHEIHIRSASPQIRLVDSDGTNTYGDLQYNGVSFNIISRGGASAFGAITFARTDGTSTINTAQINAAGDYRFYDDTGTEGMRWDASTSRLGIGTSSPYRTLTVSGDQVVEGLLEVTAATPQILFSVPSGGLDSRIHNDGSGNFIFGTGTNSTTPTERMRIDSSGNVGIGTASPGVELDVVGTTDPQIRVLSSGTGASDDTILRSQIGGTTASNYLYFGDADDNNSGQIRYVHSDDSMRFYAGATTERLRLYSSATIFYNGTTEIGRFASNNRFGIGTSVPETNLHVHSTGNTLAQISSSFNGSTTTGLYIDTTGDTSKARLAFQKGGATIGVLGFNHASSATNEGYTFSTSLGTRALLQGDGLRIYNTSGGVSHFFTYNENGGEIQLIDETGNVGTLIDEVSSASRFLQLVNGSVVQIGLGSSNTTGNIQFIGGGSELARFTNAGRLGIANTNPQAQVHAVADGAYTPAYYAQNDGSAASWARMDFYNNQASDTGIIYRDQGGNFAFRNDNSSGTATTTSIVGGNTTAGHITFNTTVSSEAMRVESSGEVGIGTATPSAKLHVYDGTTNGIIKVQSNNGYAALQAVASGSNSSYIFFNNGNQETGRIQSANGGIMVFYTNATQERMRIQSTGVLRLERSLAEHSTALSGSGTVQINYRLGNNFTHTLSGNTTYTFVTPEASGYVSAITLKVIQDSTARTITWPASVDWAGGTAPTLSTGSGDVDIFVFVTYDGGTTYYGFTAGQDMS